MTQQHQRSPSGARRDVGEHTTKTWSCLRRRRSKIRLVQLVVLRYVRSEPSRDFGEYRTFFLCWSLALIGVIVLSRFLPSFTGCPSAQEWCSRFGTTVFKIRRTHQVSYLSDMIEESKPQRTFRSSSRPLLKEPTVSNSDCFQTWPDVSITGHSLGPIIGAPPYFTPHSTSTTL